MTIPLTYVRHVVTTAGQTVFNVPSLVLPGAPFGGTIATLLVKVDGGTPPTYTHSASLNQVTFLTGLPAGAVVEAWRTTPVNESLVSFPPATQWTPTHNNKSITQLLMCIQELWGGLQELETVISFKLKDLESYVNQAIAGAFKITGIAGATCTLAVSNGDTYLDTPYLFNNGILMVGGSMYNLSDPSHVTLSVVNGHTRITFNQAILGDHVAILIVLATEPGTEYTFDGLRASTYSAAWAAGVTTLLVPFVFDKGLLILGGSTYDFGDPSHGVTLTDVGGVSTLVTLAAAPITDHEAIVVMFNNGA